MIKLTTIVFLLAFSTLAFVHVVALQLFLYWHLWWFDIPMHILGGAVVALGAFVLRDLRMYPLTGIARSFWQSLALVGFVMVVWELFELWAGIPITAAYPLDTMIDVSVGFVGGVVGYYVAISLDKL